MMYDKEVYYSCHQCEYEKKLEDQEPCHECLNNPVRHFSHKPLRFKKKQLKRRFGLK